MTSLEIPGFSWLKPWPFPSFSPEDVALAASAAVALRSEAGTREAFPW